MVQKLLRQLKPLLKPLVAIALVLVLVLGHADGAWAARAGGRIGGGSFRAPRPTAPAPRTYTNPGGGYYPGGGFGFPFLFPIFGFGGGFGGLFTLLIFIAIANFLVRSFRSIGEGSDYGTSYASSTNPSVSVVKLQVGLLAQARSLQDDLNRIAVTADTGSSQGLAQLLQETTLSLLRHPDYWAYAASEDKQTRLLSAEAEFNRYTLSARSKFSEETLSNVNSQLSQSQPKAVLPGDGAETAPGEYILATLVVATQGKLNLPSINSSDDLRRALSQVGAISSDDLLAVEVLWTPQQSGETLTADEMIAEYPDLKLV
jgi:uncharacterized membrane protein